MSTTTPANAIQSSSAAASGSLLEGLEIPERSREGGGGWGGDASRPFVPEVLRENAVTRWTRKHKRWAWGVLAALVIGGGIGAYFALRPMPEPDFAVAPMDDILDFALLNDDFNKLPVEKRWELLKDLIERFSKMSADDSVAMASWAAMIEGDLREQLMKNASLLAIDTWDGFANDYKSVPEPERDEFLDKTIVDFMKRMEGLNPRGPRDISDEERLAEARKQADRDQKMIRSDDAPSSGELGQMADFLRNGMGKFATPQAQQRSQQLMRDMTRHLRGQDLATGKPKPRP